jgi:predicted protein tyrosine phosphatase
MISSDTEIRILPWYAIEWERFDGPYAVISIMVTSDQIVHMPKGDGCVGVLRLNFPDLDKPLLGWKEEELFSAKQAGEIWDFVDALPEIETLLIHCEAGVSRSPAVGAAIARTLGQEFPFNRYVPNPRVYRIMLETWNDRHSAKEPTALPPKPPSDIKIWRDLF